MKSKKDVSTIYLLPLSFWGAFVIHVLVLTFLFYVSLDCLYSMTLSGGYVSAILNEIIPEEVMQFHDAFSSSFQYHGTSIDVYTYGETKMSCSGNVTLVKEDGSTYTQRGALIFLDYGVAKFQATSNESNTLRTAEYSVQYIPPNSHTEYTLVKDFNENFIFRMHNDNSMFETSEKYSSHLRCDNPLTLSLIYASVLDDSGNKVPINSCMIVPSSDDNGVSISLTQNNHLSGDYSFYMPLSGNLDMIIDYADSVRVCGSGTIYYSDTASEKEYLVHRRNIACNNNFFDGFNRIFNRSEPPVSEQWDIGHYNIQYSYTPEAEQLSFDGEADYISVSGYNLVLRSPSNWMRDNPYLLPSAILTVFGGAISLTLSEKARTANPSVNKRRPTNQTSTKRRMLHMIKALRRK